MTAKVFYPVGLSNAADKREIISDVLNEATLLMTGSLQSAIFNCASFSVIATDAKGVIQIFNVGAERMLGYTAAEVMKKITPADISDPQEVIARAEELSLELGTPITPGFEALAFKASRGIEDNYELTYIRKDGSRFPAVVSVTALRDDQDAIIGYLLIGTDNTARKRFEAEQGLLDQELHDRNVELQRAKLLTEKTSFAKSGFFSNMSHELRSPLTAILGFAQLMESESPSPTPAQKESIAKILQAGWHLLTIINEILDLAKVESRQTPLANEPVSLAEVMLECRGMIEAEAQQRGIRMTFPRFDTPCIIIADRARVKQVLINLLSNAIKYNSKQGMVEVKCTACMPGRILVTVRDTGKGLGPEQLEQLFQTFSLLGKEAGNKEGTGIGLVVAKRLVEQLGGTIGVESTVGVGSVFWVEFVSVDEPDLAIKELKATVSEQLHSTRGARLQTLLYVEDNPANLDLIGQIIARRPDIQLLTALNGKRGIEIAHASQPDVILMDINLPGISGIEAMKILCSDSTTAHIPVIALSANAMPSDIEKGLAEGFFRYITKPIKVDEFMAALDVALEYAGNTAVKSS